MYQCHTTIHPTLKYVLTILKYYLLFYLYYNNTALFHMLRITPYMYARFNFRRVKLLQITDFSNFVFLFSQMQGL